LGQFLLQQASHLLLSFTFHNFLLNHKGTPPGNARRAQPGKQ
jgi:hypothetical protein